LRYFREHIDQVYAHFGGQITYTFLNSLAGRVGSVGARQEFTVLATLAQTRGYITLAQLNNINAVLQTGVDWQFSFGNDISRWLIENNF